MGRLQELSQNIGRGMVATEGDVNVTVGEAASLWFQHLILKVYSINELDTGSGSVGGGYSIGMGEKRPLVFGKEN